MALALGTCRWPAPAGTERRRQAAMAVATVRPAANEMPTITTVFLGEDGLHHARCGQPMAFLRKRQGLELDFHCRVCHEHVTLPEYALSRVPVGEPATV
jgi:hypothetical protein